MCERPPWPIKSLGAGVITWSRRTGIGCRRLEPDSDAAQVASSEEPLESQCANRHESSDTGLVPASKLPMLGAAWEL